MLDVDSITVKPVSQDYFNMSYDVIDKNTKQEPFNAVCLVWFFDEIVLMLYEDMDYS